jgi:hypothetical protein
MEENVCASEAKTLGAMLEFYPSQVLSCKTCFNPRDSDFRAKALNQQAKLPIITLGYGHIVERMAYQGEWKPSSVFKT